MKQQPKQKKNKEKGFDIYFSQFFLTYSRCNLTKEVLLEYLEKIVNKKTEKQKYFISNYIIVNENHKDESLHKHAYIKLDKKIQIRKKTLFDIKLEDETIYHPNIQGVRSTKAVIDYILKHDDYISKYKIDNLQIAQIIIEKEIKEEIKCVENHSIENFDEKIVYWFDNKNWFDGYDKQPILILDNFDGTQLYYSTFLKILSGQQRRLEIKGSKELNYIKHVIITSNYSLKELYRKDDYNRDLRLVF
ncbi:Geminivirus Rep catalytic domain-containing protein [Gigaspora rosea]|uniref:Geminivirus Rep catalytic domain-containing protein n=1 Tax=Gigaspora rosea TaxID=44941 RepID=A0A397W2X4_9GLOM|nr:Geminivirus Rep catalytic domain-containing protein [Gigaspora rosea]